MKTALLCVSFGTSVPNARKSITAVEQALQQAASQADFFRAFTSPTIRRHLAAKGETIQSVNDALAKLRACGYESVIVQPTHFLYGLEYENLKKSVEEAKSGFLKLTLGAPLLSQTEDLKALADILCEQFPREENGALVFMGHGTSHFSNVVYPAMQTVFHILGRKDVFVGTVEGWPNLSQIRSQLKEGRYQKVRLAPMMLVAGDHALNDMAGEDEDSWKSVLTFDGFSVSCILEGLGMLPGVQKLYQDHLKALL